MAPVLPAIPIIPNSPSAARKPSRDAPSAPTMKELEAAPVTTDATPQTVAESEPVEIAPAPSPQPPPPPKSWADLVRSKNSAPLSQPVIAGSQLPSGLLAPKTGALSDVLSQLNLESTQGSSKITLLQPRGLVNTGNMCYMNSVCLKQLRWLLANNWLGSPNGSLLHSFLRFPRQGIKESHTCFQK